MDIVDNFEELEELINDVGKAVMQILIVHFFSNIIDGEGELFSEKFLKRTIYIIIAILVYHLLIKKYILKRKRNSFKKN